LGIHGTVLSEGESLDSARVRAAAGPGNALAYHTAYEFGGDPTALPGGQTWLYAIALARDFLDVDAILASGRYSRERLLDLAAAADDG